MQRYLTQICFIFTIILTNLNNFVYSSAQIPNFNFKVIAQKHNENILLGIKLKLPSGWKFYTPTPKGYSQLGFSPEILYHFSKTIRQIRTRTNRFNLLWSYCF